MAGYGGTTPSKGKKRQGNKSGRDAGRKPGTVGSPISRASAAEPARAPATAVDTVRTSPNAPRFTRGPIPPQGASRTPPSTLIGLPQKSAPPSRTSAPPSGTGRTTPMVGPPSSSGIRPRPTGGVMAGVKPSLDMRHTGGAGARTRAMPTQSFPITTPQIAAPTARTSVMPRKVATGSTKAAVTTPRPASTPAASTAPRGATTRVQGTKPATTSSQKFAGSNPTGAAPKSLSRAAPAAEPAKKGKSFRESKYLFDWLAGK